MGVYEGGLKTEKALLQFFKDFGPPFYVGHITGLVVGNVITVDGQPFTVVREIPEKLVYDTYVPMAAERGYDVLDKCEDFKYYELVTD